MGWALLEGRERRRRGARVGSDECWKAPRDAVRFIVRWRVTGFANPRRRTFTDADRAALWGRRIAAARMLNAPRDDKGWPLLERGDESDGQCAAIERARSAQASAAADSEPQAPAHAAQAELPDMPVALPADTGHVGHVGLDVDGYIDALVEGYLPYWEQTNQNRWWLDQLAFVKAVFRYPDDDARLVRPGVTPGASMDFRLLGPGDFYRALNLRRRTNLQKAHHNRQRQGRYERLMAEYEVKIVAWQAR